MICVRALKAGYGDCILVSHTNKDDQTFNILIDGGIPSTYQKKNKKGKYEDGDLKKELNKNINIDLLILTHIDHDHIAGIINWLRNDANAFSKIKKVWFNSGEIISSYLNKKYDVRKELIIPIAENTDTSIKQGKTFSHLCKQNNISFESVIKSLDELEIFGLRFKILSPNSEKLEVFLDEWEADSYSLDTALENDYGNRLADFSDDNIFSEDDSPSNGSSIAFVLSDENDNYLFLGDSHPSVVVESLKYFGYTKSKPLHAKFIKLSHHGSRNNTSKELLELVSTETYIISTNGSKYSHPHKECLSRIIRHNPKANLVFNYEHLDELIFTSSDKKDYPDFTISYSLEQ
ncbi:Zn-dependent hydrolase [Rahnella variigena]|uniref:ComEC/Rec2 family competence protein n=1 Tax=Rahnella variigena TaxID=574964 RepID=UPI00101DD242|nr:MBL fold metallo-hydrolase [Rahnella variigena]RYJ16441.1 Zn-dependent hydrolase [Rahnella variigena]